MEEHIICRMHVFTTKLTTLDMQNLKHDNHSTKINRFRRFIIL